MSITLEQYIDFYNKNKDIILMKEDSNYPINETGLKQWVASVKNKKNNILCHNLSNAHKAYDKEAINNCDIKDNSDTYNLFAYMFSKILRHISFKEMCDKIKLIVAEIITLYTTKKYDNIYIFIDGIAQKSNTWISLLYVKYLLEVTKTSYAVITEIITKSKVIDNFDGVNAEVGNNKSILILHIDDMIYSGNQVVESITRNTEHITQIISTNKTVDYYLCVAYISNNAKERFEHIYAKLIKFFGKTEVIDNFITQANKKINDKRETFTKNEKAKFNDLLILCGNTEDNTYKLGNRAFRCYSASPLSAVYFDHKLPDIVSFFNRIVNYGMFPANTDDNGNYMKFDTQKIQYKSPAQHIITNCNIDENKDTSNNQKNCPPAFYKQLQYKFKSNDIYMGDDLHTKYYIVAQLLGIIESQQIKTQAKTTTHITSQAHTTTLNNNTYDSTQFNYDLKKLIPVKNIQKQTYDKFKENVVLDNSFKNKFDIAFFLYVKPNPKNYNIFYILYAFIILYCIIIYKFKLVSDETMNITLLSDVIIKLLNNINNINNTVILDINKLINYLDNTFIKTNTRFNNKTLLYYLRIAIDKTTNTINTITIHNIT